MLDDECERLHAEKKQELSRLQARTSYARAH